MVHLSCCTVLHRWDAETSTYAGTPLGKAALASGMAPEDALKVSMRFTLCGLSWPP